jgi:hypothetical protein
VHRQLHEREGVARRLAEQPLADPRRERGHVRRQQRRLPDAGLTSHHQRAAAFADAVDQAVEYPSSRSRPTKGGTVISQP